MLVADEGCSALVLPFSIFKVSHAGHPGPVTNWALLWVIFGSKDMSLLKLIVDATFVVL